MKVDLGRIECRSAFELPNNGVRVLEMRGTAPTQLQDVRLVELADVLYLPHILERGQSICLAEQRIVPTEAVNAWSVGFFQTSRSSNPEYRRHYDGDFEVAVYEQPVCILGNLFSRNFGHWTEELLKVALLEHSGQECRYAIPALPSYARDFLTLLGIGGERFADHDHPTVFARAPYSRQRSITKTFPSTRSPCCG